MSDEENPSRVKNRLNSDKSALLVTKDGSYRHNLSLVADKVSRLTNIPSKQAYIFLRRFAHKEAGGGRGITVKIARELDLKRNTTYIQLALRNIYQTCPEPQKVRNRAHRKDFKSSVLSKAHQSVLTLMFIKSVDPEFDISKVEEECRQLFDHYLPDISMIANGDLTVLDAEEDDEKEDAGEDMDVGDPRQHPDWDEWKSEEYYCKAGCDGTGCYNCGYRSKCIMHRFSYNYLHKFKKEDESAHLPESDNL